MAIVSFQNKFVFIKTRKTAGTSMEMYLSKWCHDDDVVTPIHPENPLHRPRNYEDEWGRLKFYNHMSAVEIRSNLPKEFGTFFKFCFERHPVEKCLSFFAMLLNSPAHQSPDNPRTWDEYLERGILPVDVDRYTGENGELLVDKIYKYENFAASLRDISMRVGFRYSTLSYREKSGFRYGVPSFEDVMANRAQRNRIFDAFKVMMELVDYA